MNLAPLIDQPNGFQGGEWPQDEAESLHGRISGEVMDCPKRKKELEHAELSLRTKGHGLYEPGRFDTRSQVRDE